MVALWHTRLHFRCQVLRTGFSYEQHPPCTLLPCCLFLIYGYSTGSTTAQHHQQSISQHISSMKRTNLANITFSVHLHYKVTYTLWLSAWNDWSKLFVHRFAVVFACGVWLLLWHCSVFPTGLLPSHRLRLLSLAEVHCIAPRSIPDTTRYLAC